MTIYDVLDIVRQINDKAYVVIVEAIADKASLRNSLEVSMRKFNSYYALVEVFQIDKVLTPMQMKDLEDRLS